MTACSAVDLFCGCGGLTLGLERSGFEVLLGVDNWPIAAESYGRNFEHGVLTGDLAGLSAKAIREQGSLGDRPIDLVVGGPPCQGFSIQRIGADNDVRNHLVLEFGRLVVEFEPRLFIMENVPGLLGKRGRELAVEFESRMRSAGYSCGAAIIDAADFGVPQHRRRVIYCGWKQDSPDFHLPAATHGEGTFVTALEALGDLPSPPDDGTPHPEDPLHRRSRLSATNQRRIELIPPGGGMQDLPVELRVACHRKGADRIGHRYVYGRLAPDRPASTITARFDSFTRGRFGHYAETRNISLREGARLQSFPDSFFFEGTQEEIAAQIGNAVPPLLAQHIGAAALTWLSGSEQPKSLHELQPVSAVQSEQMSIFRTAASEG